MKSPAYWHPVLYDFFIKFIWRKKKNIMHQTWEAIMKWIPENADVLEIAAGSGRFYRDVLKGYVKKYRATDINPVFVKYLQKLGIEAILSDVRNSTIPPADVIVIISVLYNFKDIADVILNKLVKAAFENVIIVEPINNPLNIFSWRDKIRAKLVDIGEGPIYDRFNKNEIYDLSSKISVIKNCELLPDNQIILVLEGKNSKRIN